jgi:hypothetical protein
MPFHKLLTACGVGFSEKIILISYMFLLKIDNTTARSDPVALLTFKQFRIQYNNSNDRSFSSTMFMLPNCTLVSLQS